MLGFHRARSWIGAPRRREMGEAMSMILRGLLLIGLLAGSVMTARAEDRGTADEAKAMVAKAIELYREKGSNSFSIINKGAASGFRDRDLYVYVFSGGIQPKARIVANPVDRKLIGVNVDQLKDADGNQYGLDMLGRARPTGVWIDYKWLDPRTKKVEQRSNWVVAYGGYIFVCGITKS
jgi:cytochrome c